MTNRAMPSPRGAPRPSRLGFVTLLVPVLALVASSACGGRVVGIQGDGAPGGENGDGGPPEGVDGSAWLSVAVPPPPALDVLVVADNSIDSDARPWRAGLALEQFLAALENELRRPVDLHLGATTTDLGTGPHEVYGCTEEGDGGALRFFPRYFGPDDPAFVVDREPSGCHVVRADDGRCIDHTCTPEHCDGLASSAFGFDPVTGCPRCRNAPAELERDSLFGGIGLAGNGGCGFEQPLEAMRLALDDHPRNEGFRRPEAELVVLIATTADDCSVTSPDLFTPGTGELDSPLGPLSTFRCFEFGVTCDEDDRLATGLRQGCRLREDAGGALHPIRRYADFLAGQSPSGQVHLLVVSGPVPGEGVGVSRDGFGWPAVDRSCVTHGPFGGWPALRLRALLEAVHGVEGAEDRFVSVCDDDLSWPFARIGRQVAEALDLRACPAAPLEGCEEVYPGYDRPAGAPAAEDRCRPTCEVADVTDAGLPAERREPIPPCLEVCADAPCEGNSDPSLAFSLGHPPSFAPDLPVPACWHVSYRATCTASRHAEIAIARRAAAPSGSVPTIRCLREVAR